MKKFSIILALVILTVQGGQAAQIKRLDHCMGVVEEPFEVPLRGEPLKDGRLPDECDKMAAALATSGEPIPPVLDKVIRECFIPCYVIVEDQISDTPAAPK